MTALTPANDTANDDPQEREPLDAIFQPRAVAVIGATEKAGSVGRTILWNLIAPVRRHGLPGQPQPPGDPGDQGVPSIGAIHEPVDLAVVVTPPPPRRSSRSAGRRASGVIVISAGFKEVGPEGAELERRTWRPRGATGCASSGRTAWA